MKTPLEATPSPGYLQQLSDAELLQLYQTTVENETLAEQLFNVIYSRHTMAIWYFIACKAPSLEDAEDIFVDTWRIAIEGMFRLVLESSFRGWLLGIARHTMAAYYPRCRSGANLGLLLQSGSRRSVLADCSLDELLVNLESDLGTLVEILHDPNEANNPALTNLRQEEVALLLDQALPRLRERSPASFEVVYLAYFAGLSNREIAAELGKNEGAIKTAKSRAHTYLAEILRELLDQMDEGTGWFEELR